MQTIPSIDSLIDLKVKHGSPGYEAIEVIDDVAFFHQTTGRVHILFESGFETNMTEAELEKFMEDGEVHYSQHFRNDKDTGLAVLKLAEY